MMSFSSSLSLGESSVVEGRQVFKNSSWAVPCYKMGVSSFPPSASPLPSPVLGTVGV